MKKYIDGYQQNDLPLFNSTATRNEQAKQIGSYVAEFDGKHYDKTKDKDKADKTNAGRV